MTDQEPKNIPQLAENDTRKNDHRSPDPVDHEGDESRENDRDDTLIQALRMAVATRSIVEEEYPIDDEFRQQVETRARKLAIEETSVSATQGDYRAQLEANRLDFATMFEPAKGPDELGWLGPYRMMRLMGQGGMGLVFDAEDSQLKRRVALKVMHPKLAVSPDHRARFLREAQAAAKVDHENICPIYQVGEHHQTPFIAMPFLSGETLESRLQRTEFSLADTIKIAKQIASGLMAAHVSGLIHRDIKPSNIWLESKADGTERTRILDFGLARLDDSDSQLTLVGTIIGTPAYMSPEQAKGTNFDHRSDLFSLGILLYEMLTGVRPFSGENSTAILSSLLTDNPPAPHELQGHISAEMSQLVMRLLSKNPAARPQSAKQVEEILVSLSANGDRTEIVSGSSRKTVRQKPVTQGAALERLPAAARIGTRPRVRIATAIAFVIAFFVLGAAGIILVTTKNGTLVIEADDDVDLRLRQGEIHIYDTEGLLQYKLSPGENNKSLPLGNYLVKVEGVDGVQLDTSKFEMKRFGKVVVRATARAPEPVDSVADGVVPKTVSPTKTSFSLSADLFPGRLVVEGSDQEFGSNLVRASKVLGNDANSAQNNHFLLHRENALKGDVSSSKLFAKYSSGAFALRCRIENAAPFVNMRIRHRDSHTRWLSLLSANDLFQFVVQDHEFTSNRWVHKQPTILAKGKKNAWGWRIGETNDVFGRWSEVDYDLWINGQHVVGGEIESEALFRGEAGPVEIGMVATDAGTIQLWFDELLLWDQSELTPSQSSPKALPARPIPGILIR